MINRVECPTEITKDPNSALVPVYRLYNPLIKFINGCRYGISCPKAMLAGVEVFKGSDIEKGRSTMAYSGILEKTDVRVISL